MRTWKIEVVYQGREGPVYSALHFRLRADVRRSWRKLWNRAGTLAIAMFEPSGKLHIEHRTGSYDGPTHYINPTPNANSRRAKDRPKYAMVRNSIRGGYKGARQDDDLSLRDFRELETY